MVVGEFYIYTYIYTYSESLHNGRKYLKIALSDPQSIHGSMLRWSADCFPLINILFFVESGWMLGGDMFI